MLLGPAPTANRAADMPVGSVEDLHDGDGTGPVRRAGAMGPWPVTRSPASTDDSVRADCRLFRPGQSDMTQV